MLIILEYIIFVFVLITKSCAAIDKKLIKVNDFINLNPMLNVYDNDYCMGSTNKSLRLQTFSSQFQPKKNLKGTYSQIETNKDPMFLYQNLIQHYVFGEPRQVMEKLKSPLKVEEKVSDLLIHYPSGDVMRSELFMNRSGVHLPKSDVLHRDHARLKITKDFMQTAVNAFAIFLHGSLKDILNLPPNYILKSARTISMMKISREKYVATWEIIKGNKSPHMISYEVLELYRPLFKYISGKEMARLNLRSNRILTYIGTHADLNRHQVGVIASKYLKINPRWSDPMYLNMMNNLLCGVPFTYMRKLDENTYLQLSDQVFYHVRACDPLQRRFYLTMMTKTQALGKSYSWSARDVSRLGLLLTEVEGPQLSAINPEAMSGITAQVMKEMPAKSLVYITDIQMQYLSHKPLNILARKLNKHKAELKNF